MVAHDLQTVLVPCACPWTWTWLVQHSLFEGRRWSHDPGGPVVKFWWPTGSSELRTPFTQHLKREARAAFKGEGRAALAHRHGQTGTFTVLMVAHWGPHHSACNVQYNTWSHRRFYRADGSSLQYLQQYNRLIYSQTGTFTMLMVAHCGPHHSTCKSTKGLRYSFIVLRRWGIHSAAISNKSLTDKQQQQQSPIRLY